MLVRKYISCYDIDNAQYNLLDISNGLSMSVDVDEDSTRVHFKSENREVVMTLLYPEDNEKAEKILSNESCIMMIPLAVTRYFGSKIEAHMRILTASVLEARVLESEWEHILDVILEESDKINIKQTKD